MEHFVVQEIRAWLSYKDLGKKMAYWHTLENKYEVDVVIGEAEVGIEIKSTTNVSSSDTKG